MKKNDLRTNRLGISVSKKVGKSVVRHRLKRLYLEAFRCLRKKIHREGFDLVIIARKGAANMIFLEAVKDLHKLLVRGKLIDKNNSFGVNKDI